MHGRDISSEVGTRLLFENERVRVWDLCLEPGEATGMHAHNTDYLYVVIGDGELQRCGRLDEAQANLCSSLEGVHEFPRIAHRGTIHCFTTK